ncbi:acetate--CoA ligase [Halarsenatibacter silvermanii]|uniref:Acetate--CoA ligase n=1 Tax=Halarsenatibacter silvermanii TaxID=321763 RepID=A0A1G9ITE3_9FIRM|nr:acetate--CoA ligase [Halarsenatibacter silvermanii]SDL28578.1 acetyl-coenzyme A synthetase [Halarsenatibacter silvermanii]
MSSEDGEEVFDVLSEGEEVFAPPESFKEQANAGAELYEIENYQEYWAKEAEKLDWFEKWDQTLRWEPPFAQWFVGGKINASYNCLDRHLDSFRKNKAALIWEGEPGDERVLTYNDLHRKVCKFATVLKNQGVQKGDIVTIYLPMIPEAVIAMLACARIGAPHSVVFAGFGPGSLAQRIENADSSFLITADGYYRRGRLIHHKNKSDQALEQTDKVEQCVVVERCGLDVTMNRDRDYWWKDLMSEVKCETPAVKLDSEDLLFLMYTSGTTGKPKGVVHTIGGYMTHVTSTSKYVFDLKEDDTYWCSADVGWITGHSYIVYGILSNGATAVMYEGAPDYPDNNRTWEIIEKYGVNIFYTAPTAIRSFMKHGKKYPQSHNLNSLRLLGSVGEPINPKVWKWYHKNVGNENCPIVDTWWQTETGGIMLSPLPGVIKTRPGSVTRPLPGISAEVLDEEGEPADSGYLAITKPWPGMLRTVYQNDERYKKTYWSKWDDETYFPADGAKIDEDGYFWILGRIDDVINVSGHRLSTMEIESSLVSHSDVAEAAVVGGSDDLKGQVPVAYVMLQEEAENDKLNNGEDEELDFFNADLEEELKDYVAEDIGAIARPRDVTFVPDLPKTRSGKIMRRLLQDITEEEELSDTTTLKNPEIAEKIQDIYC